MANEILKRDQNSVPVLAGISDDVYQEIRMLRVEPTTGRLLTSSNSSGGGNSVIGGNYGFQRPLTGNVDGSNRTFTWANAPTAIVVDGVILQKTEQGGVVNWTGTTTTILTVPPVNSAFGEISNPSNFQLPLTGVVNGSNQTYTWTTAPTAIVVDGTTLQKVEQSGTVNWTGTTTTVLTVPPVNSIIAEISVTSGGVSSIIAGTNINISPSGGTGDVTINATGGAPSNLTVTTQTTTYAILTTDQVVLCNGTFTATLPTASGVTGYVYYIKNIGTGVVTVACTGAETIDGVTTNIIRTTNSGFSVVSDGTNWVIINTY
jgi:hypothetical protein